MCNQRVSSSIDFHRRKSGIQVWNDMKVSKWVNYPFKIQSTILSTHTRVLKKIYLYQTVSRYLDFHCSWNVNTFFLCENTQITCINIHQTDVNSKHGQDVICVFLLWFVFSKFAEDPSVFVGHLRYTVIFLPLYCKLWSTNDFSTRNTVVLLFVSSRRLFRH